MDKAATSKQTPTQHRAEGKKERRDGRRPMHGRTVVVDVSDEAIAHRVSVIVKQLGGTTTEEVGPVGASIDYACLVSDSGHIAQLALLLKQTSDAQLCRVVLDLNSTSIDKKSRRSTDKENAPPLGGNKESKRPKTFIEVKNAGKSPLEVMLIRSSMITRLAVRQRIRLVHCDAFLTRAGEMKRVQERKMAGNHDEVDDRTALKKRRRVPIKTAPIGQPLSAPFVFVGDRSGEVAPLTAHCHHDRLPMHVGADLHLTRCESLFNEPSHKAQTRSAVQTFFPPPHMPPFPQLSTIHSAPRTSTAVPSSVAIALPPVLPSRSSVTLADEERHLSPLKSRSTFCNVCQMETLDLNKHVGGIAHRTRVQGSGILDKIDEFIFTKHALIPSLHVLINGDAPCEGSCEETGVLPAPPSSSSPGKDIAVSVVSTVSLSSKPVATCSALDVESLLDGANKRVITKYDHDEEDEEDCNVVGSLASALAAPLHLHDFDSDEGADDASTMKDDGCPNLAIAADGRIEIGARPTNGGNAVEEEEESSVVVDNSLLDVHNTCKSTEEGHVLDAQKGIDRSIESASEDNKMGEDILGATVFGSSNGWAEITTVEVTAGERVKMNMRWCQAKKQNACEETIVCVPEVMTIKRKKIATRTAEERRPPHRLLSSPTFNDRRRKAAPAKPTTPPKRRQTMGGPAMHPKMLQAMRTRQSYSMSIEDEEEELSG